MRRKKKFTDMDKGVLCNLDMKLLRYRILYFAMALLLGIYLLIVFVPSLWLLLAGFKDAKEMYAIPASFFPSKIQLSKLGVVWNQMRFYKYYINTVIMAIGAVMATLVVSGLAGFVLSRLKPKGSSIVYLLFFSLMLMPSTMNMVPLYITFKDFSPFHINMLDSYLPIWLMSAANMFYIFLFKSTFDSISASLIEAAKIDGASNLQIFFKIMLPLSAPVMITVAIFVFNGQLGNFFWPNLIISDNEKSVLGMQIYKLKASNLTMDYQMLSLLFSIVPQLILFSFFQKYIIGGINIGGVKG